MKNTCTGDICRPGGYKITERALEFCDFPKDAKLADIGCGLGATVRHIRQNHGYDICGLEKDRNAVKLAGTQFVNVGDATELPFDSGELDGLLFECSLSKMDNPELVLIQCQRVLKPGGYLIISDIYARGLSATLSGLLGRVETKEELMNKLKANGFVIELFEDYSKDLQAMWGQLIFEYGAKALCENLEADREDLKKIKCGYCLIIAKKGVSL
ncbi:MAG TPA: methyltransferase domain-containing protein [Negativicutes bacterium]|nr:methyltransferase domain-containing protein [Negativicutes bacterium]